MARIRKVFISHTAHDDARTASLLAALKSKRVDVWYDRTPAEQSGDLTPPY
ncbi:MAG TPA: hypothetical protein VIC27_02370 [Ktedonobacterales bacterium]|jgi:hypothetical protein